MMLELEPKQFQKLFIRTDQHFRRRWHSVTAPIQPLVRPEALRRWAIKKAKRFAAGQGFLMSEPIVEYQRDVGMRHWEVYVWFEFATSSELPPDFFQFVTKAIPRLINCN